MCEDGDDYQKLIRIYTIGPVLDRLNSGRSCGLSVTLNVLSRSIRFVFSLVGWFW